MAKPPEIDPERTYVTSDSHFGHKNIVDFSDRPAEHEEIMVRHWAETVPDDATVLHLGDLSWKGNAYFKHIIAPKLTGENKLIILGNHDRQRYSFYRDCGFKIVKDFEQTIELRGRRFVVSFSHYPLKKSRGPHHIHIHGHIHNSGYGGKHHAYAPFSMGQINMSVEQTHYTPVNLAILLDSYVYGCYEPELTNPELEALRAT